VVIVLIGNPYQLAFLVEVVAYWNQNGVSPFYNGILLICVDGEMYPKQLNTATLSVDIPCLESVLTNVAIDEKLFNLDKDTAYKKMHKATFPSWRDIERGVDNDYQYDLSPQSFSDCDCIAFVVSNGEQVRILVAQLYYDREESAYDIENIDISEAYVTLSEIKEIVSELKTIIDQNGQKRTDNAS